MSNDLLGLGVRVPGELVDRPEEFLTGDIIFVSTTGMPGQLQEDGVVNLKGTFLNTQALSEYQNSTSVRRFEYEEGAVGPIILRLLPKSRGRIPCKPRFISLDAGTAVKYKMHSFQVKIPTKVHFGPGPLKLG